MPRTKKTSRIIVCKACGTEFVPPRKIGRWPSYCGCIGRKKRVLSEKPPQHLNPQQFLEDLKMLPGYRELIKQRISLEQSRRYQREARLFKWENSQSQDIDNLAPEIEPCG